MKNIEPEIYYSGSEVRVVVAEDPGTGKSTLISYVTLIMSMPMRRLMSPPEDDYGTGAYDEADDTPDVVETKALPEGFAL
ncbi:hypothetical protein FEM48_Zijuj07G0086400 [Ziziphus jujuba var. spinosa]|uniref:Uncharacterized protein n=1 Tax=Ziziphus jujuba var. spinosa TaxID=714518 RepID=A0A978V3L7_ZIZJJ|nr:hypothetical protein FEM48_Zijuj07G0086400 [Ziziphus jujuba var. spinosa]